MFRCGKTLIALALLMATPVAVSAQTTDNPPAPSSSAQPASQQPPSAELLKP
jgi:Spy/CpxP family protein refolding chaperone